MSKYEPAIGWFFAVILTIWLFALSVANVARIIAASPDMFDWVAMPWNVAAPIWLATMIWQKART